MDIAGGEGDGGRASGLPGGSRVIVPNRVALRVSEIHFLPHRGIFNHVFSSYFIAPSPRPPSTAAVKEEGGGEDITWR